MKNENDRIRGNASVKIFSAVFTLLMFVPVVMNAQAGKVNFSGNWEMNTEKSAQPQQGQGNGMRMGGGNIVVTQQGNNLSVARTMNRPDGQSSTNTLKYTLDGKESTNTSPRGEVKSVAKWSADGKSLTIESTRTMDMNGTARQMKSTEVWTLDDAKTLSITTTRQTPNGENTFKVVYDKK